MIDSTLSVVCLFLLLYLFVMCLQLEDDVDYLVLIKRSGLNQLVVGRC